MQTQSTQSSNLLAIQEISKSFGSVRAVNNLSIVLHPGEVLGLLGPNGAGKTTTIKMILGLLEADSGSISVMGKDPIEDEIFVKKMVGYVAEEAQIFKSLTPRELFNFLASVRELPGDTTSERLAEYMDSLEAIPYYDKVITTLSRGNKQKVQLIAALLHNPKILILDEPLAGLDAKSVKVVKEIIQIHKERGGSVIFSTHILEVAQEMCDRIAIINKGILVGTGTIGELRVSAQQTDSTLEEIFLHLTNQDESINETLRKLRSTLA